MAHINYLPLMSMMTKEQLDSFLSDVQAWDETVYPRLEKLTEAWEDADCKDYETGMQLVSALQSARSFLPYAFDAPISQRIRMMRVYIDKIRQYDASPKDVVNRRTGIAVKSYNHAAAAPKESTDEYGVSTGKTVDEVRAAVIAEREAYESKNVGDRPRHFDEWMDKMSAELREDVQQLGTYWTELVAARQLAVSLKDNGGNAKDISTAVSNACKWEDKILAIYDRSTKEWNALKGTEGTSEEADSKKRTIGGVEVTDNKVTTGRTRGRRRKK